MCSRNFCYETLIYVEIWKVPMIGASTSRLKDLRDEGLKEGVCDCIEDFTPSKIPKSSMHLPLTTGAIVKTSTRVAIGRKGNAIS